MKSSYCNLEAMEKLPLDVDGTTVDVKNSIFIGASFIGLSSGAMNGLGGMNFLQYLLPRRKENVLNFILLMILVGLFIYFYPYNTFHYQMPPQEGITWPLPDPPRMDHVRPDYSKQREGPGENGNGVFLEGEEKVKGEEDMKKWFMNVVASDKISLDRSLPDSRFPECKAIHYPLDLPTASVVIIFTDEAWTPLMRTVHSVINRSPPLLLQEVILLDDNSQREELKGKLDDYIKRFGGVVKVIRKTVRHGLIRAKIAGAEAAKGDVVVFLDSHCEANEGWLEPLLARIKEERTAVLCPVIDHISAETMSYSGSAGVSSVGGFWWSLHFTWDPVSIAEKKRRKTKTEPVRLFRSPTMAGGLLAVDRKYFFDIGAYDPGMDIWGGENLELSFRVWMCGGSVEFIPCSHVGHIFRAGHPYNMTGPGGNKDVHGTNSKRLAEVWMDDYKRLYYLHRPDLKVDFQSQKFHFCICALQKKKVGDYSKRVALRKKLNCKSFKWYLDTIIPDKFVPDENVLGFGALRNKKSGLCLDTLQRDEKSTINLGVFSCQSGGSSSQVFSLTKTGQLRRETTCATVLPAREAGSKGAVRMPPCFSSKDKWTFEKGLLKHVGTNLCLDVKDLKSGDDILARSCSVSVDSQLWEFHKY
ncbi:unnamed protein product [Enterobius vermicularis]|uniref:Polypeptide N-acetylgalactosaminyltransferase n=1 Tax=Enterobius vermicularis TaxID=51028 RepID=A0A0N4VCW0_ENTVE|nr:unnamed protein product [Enterobius vermicularis]